MIKYGIYNITKNKFVKNADLDAPHPDSGWDYINDDLDMAELDLQKVRALSTLKQNRDYKYEIREYII